MKEQTKTHRYVCTVQCEKDLYLINLDYNHGLRGSASHVLTATGLVNGRWQFSAPYRIDTP